MANRVIEIVTWKSKPGVEDEAMISAVEGKLPDVKNLKGFLHQALYKNTKNEWVGVYHWESEADARNSNIEMADKAAFKKLLSLIDGKSVQIEIMATLQSSG
jgi:heme-degrading monooxygenase HmoA